MDRILLEQLKRAKGIVVKDRDGNRLSNFEGHDLLLIEKYVDDKNKLYIDSEYEFEFDSIVVKPKSSGLRVVPLATMKGTILDTNNEIIYIKVFGVNGDFNKCQHCLRFGNYSPLCESCANSLNVEETSWEGWIPLTAIKRITKI